jgi:hypothetical protein
MLRPQTREDAPGEFRWYVVQHRPSGLQPEDLWLIEHCRPALRKVVRPGGLGPWRLDVPLVEVYRYDQHVRAVKRVQRPESLRALPRTW